MTNPELRHLRRLAERLSAQCCPPAIPGFEVGRMLACAELVPMIYAPMVCLVVSGAKRIQAGRRIIDYGEGQHFISAVDMPVMARVTVNRNNGAYLALVLSLDADMLSDLALHLTEANDLAGNDSFSVSDADPLLLDAWRRLCELRDRPDEIAYMGRLIKQEILYRLMRSPMAAALRSVVSANPKLDRIRISASWIREHYARSISIEEMAAQAGMSVSVYHRSFKAVMEMSPLQYQKTVRLYEARSRLSAPLRDTAGVAYAVGYESASQFSREYKRLFGSPPSVHANRLSHFGK